MATNKYKDLFPKKKDLYLVVAHYPPQEPHPQGSFYIQQRTDSDALVHAYNSRQVAEVAAKRFAEESPGVKYYVFKAVSLYEGEIRPTGGPLDDWCAIRTVPGVFGPYGARN